MNNNPIGVFDSGLGGLTAVQELQKLLPNENIVYFGDTARLPYGTRSRETIKRYTAEAVEFMESHRVKMIIAACGTVSSVIGIKPYPSDTLFTGVLMPAAQAACGATRSGKIGVIGTQATIRSGSFGKAIRSIRPDTFVAGSPCPLFVPLVENGFLGMDNKVTRLVAEQYLAPVKAENIDTLILGCTHYPLLSDVIGDIMGPDVTLISPGAEAARYASALLTEQELLSDSSEVGELHCFLTDSVELFEENARILMGPDFLAQVHKATLVD